MITRSLIVFLACLNIGAGLWWWLQGPAPRHQPTLPTTTAPTLTLLSERVSKPVTPPPPAIATTRCLSIGPFAEQTSLREAVRVLTPQVEHIQLRELPTTVLMGYRLYLPAALSRAAAVATTAELRKRGVTEFYLITAGPQKHSISLGVFRALDNAEQRRAELKALGISAALESRSEEVLQWWIDVVAAPAFDWRAWIQVPPTVQEVSVDCKMPAEMQRP